MATRTEETFQGFYERVQKDLLQHRVITDNQYTRWFAEGVLSRQDVRHFAVQFSVFSNWFLVAQLKKMINAVSLEEMRASKEILANEIGCIFRPKRAESQNSVYRRSRDKENEGDPALVNTEGTVDGGLFKFKAAHFEWLLDFGKPLGLTFDDMGKRRHGTKHTLHFVDELDRLYGNEDFTVGAGASFAVENWAAAGFWKELVRGLKAFKAKEVTDLPLAFFTWHDKVEDQHADHTLEELKEVYFYPEFNEDLFITKGNEMLDGVAVFWDGLNDDRLNQRYSV